LDLLYPIPAARRAAVRLCFETVFENLSSIDGNENAMTLAREILSGILASTEARRINASEVTSYIQQLLSLDTLTDPEKLDVLLVVNEFDTLVDCDGMTNLTDERARFWWSEASSLLLSVDVTVQSLISTDWRLATTMWLKGRHSVAQICKVLGFEPIVRGTRGLLFRWGYVSILVAAVSSSLEKAGPAEREADPSDWMKWKERGITAILEIRDVLLATLPIHINPSLIDSFDIFGHLNDLDQRNGLEWPKDPRVCEGILFSLAMLTEAVHPAKTRLVVTKSSLVYRQLRNFIAARADVPEKRAAHELIDHLCTDAGAVSALHSWVEGSVSLILPPDGRVAEVAILPNT
jgi:hypothetical protein